MKSLVGKIFQLRARNIKPGFFKNELLGEADPQISILFISLWCLADREGRLEDRPKRIKAETFPYRENIDIDKMLLFLEQHNFIYRYEFEGQKYISIVNFHKHQNPHHMEVVSVIPPPIGSNNKYNHIPLSVPTRKRIYDRDGNKCVLCGSKKDLSIDHIKPISKGGSGEDSNLRTLCLSCNSSKKNNDNVSTKRCEQIMNEMSTSYTHDEEKVSHPTDSLIPDSLIPDSLIPDSRNICSNLSQFDHIWKLYPNRVGKKAALRHYKASVKTEQDYLNIQKAINNYKLSDKVKKGFIQNGSTWFNNWQDWIDYQEPKFKTETETTEQRAQRLKEEMRERFDEIENNK